MLGAWEGLEFLHSQGYLHYDIKPHNIFLHAYAHNEPPRAVIGDLDTALLKSICKTHLHEHAYPVGTPFWGTPFPKCDTRVDIVPLAICTFLCVCTESADPTLFTRIAKKVIAEMTKELYDEGHLTPEHRKYIMRNWGWVPMPDAQYDKKYIRFTADAIDTEVYTQFSMLLANSDENEMIGDQNLRPSRLIMALTNKEEMTKIWPDTSRPFIRWLILSSIQTSQSEITSMSQFFLCVSSQDDDDMVFLTPNSY